jgi:glucose-1-phosphate adenylyltransferase
MPPYRTDVRNALALILAGGRGERLTPLTRDRTKGAVPFGGLYRLIDFTLANCLNSDVRRICVLSQYKFASLERHLRQTWNFFRHELGESLTLLSPRQRLGEEWYQGTADAVYQNLPTLRREKPAQVLILASDHLYRMAYGRLLDFHLSCGADLTIACLEVSLAKARYLGIMEVDESYRVVHFAEKPTFPRSLPHRPGRALASMGVYVFSPKALMEVLREDAQAPGSRRDFGHDVIPAMVGGGWKVCAYDAQAGEGMEDFYWRDIGTIDAYWEASMELLAAEPPFDPCDADQPVYRTQGLRPPARLMGQEGASWICPGATLMEAQVQRSILSPGVRVERGAEIIDSVLMDGVQVGPNARLRRAIVDKNARIPAGFCLGLDPEGDRRWFHVSPSGIAVVPRNADLVREMQEARHVHAYYGHGTFPVDESLWSISQDTVPWHLLGEFEVLLEGAEAKGRDSHLLKGPLAKKGA